MRVSKIYFKVESGAKDTIKLTDALPSGAAFVKEKNANYDITVTASSNAKYDLVGKLVYETGSHEKLFLLSFRA